MSVVTLCEDFEPETTVVSNLFIDEYMKDANDAQIKIYLYLVRQMKAGRSTSILDMADMFNHTEREVVRSLKYWQAQGLVSLRTDERGNLTGIRLCEPRPRREQRVIPITPMTGAASGDVAVQDEPLMDTAKISLADRAEKPAAPVSPIPAAAAAAAPAAALSSGKKQETRTELFFIVEQYIGKPLSATEAQTVSFICDDLHFSDDLVDYLFQYCVGLGKKDFRYIEKVAMNWAESGISTAADAQKAIFQRGKKKSAAKTSSGRSSSKSRFNDFEQQDYDFDELERRALEG